MTGIIKRRPIETIEAILRRDNSIDCIGPMTGDDLLNACYIGDVYISPFSRSNLTPIGYNLRASDIIISTRNGLPLKIQTDGKKRYVQIAPHDTVLIATCESIYVSERVMGTFHSKVMLVSQGFGHISTTLDPLWKGPLLIAFSNPSNKKKEFVIEDDGVRSSFATLILYRLNHGTRMSHDNPPARTDVLSRFLQTPRGIKKLLIGRASKQYFQLVEKIKAPYNTYPNPLPQSNPVNNIIKDILTDIRAQLCSANYLENAQTFTQLMRTAFEQSAVSDLNPIILDLLEMTSQIAQEFDPTADDRKGTLTDLEYKNLFSRFLDIFLYQLRYEEQAQTWLASYKECSEIAQSEAFSANWLRLVLGRPWRRLISVLLGIFILIATLVFLVYTKSAGLLWTESTEALWVPLIGFDFSLLTLLFQALFKNNNG